MKILTDIVQRNVVVIPDMTTGEIAIKLSSLLAERYRTIFTLDTTHMPHLSLYQAAFPVHCQSEIHKAVKQIALCTAPLEIEMAEFNTFAEQYLYWDALKNERLTALHQKLVTTLNPLRENLLLPHHEELLSDFSPLSAAEKINLKSYGNPLCLDTERPHITLSCLVLKDELRDVFAPLNLPVRFRVQSIHLAPIGHSDTCPYLLTGYPLAGETSERSAHAPV